MFTDMAIRQLEEELKRFQLKLKAYKAKRASKPAIYYTLGCGSLESGALRRSSMDLTRALAELRKNKMENN